MLFLVFQLDADRYAIDAGRVVAVLPRVATKQLPQAPAAVAGVFDYRGEVVPLIDLCQLALERPSREVLSTRTVVVQYADGGGESRRLGLLAERVVDTVRLDPAAFAPSGVDAPQVRYLGPVARDGDGLLQWVEIRELLPESLRNLLFQQPVQG